MRIVYLNLSFVFCLIVGKCALAQTPLGTGFTYQGEIQQNGEPVDGTVHLRFSLWDAAGSGQPPTGGNQIGMSQLIQNVPVKDGIFTVILNASGEFGPNPFTIGEGRWLQIEVCADPGCGSLSILSPRQPLTASPYAFNAKSAPWSGLTEVPEGFADGVDDIGEITWESSGANIYRATGNVGIGTMTPTTTLHVSGAESRARIESTSGEKFALTEYKTNTKKWSTGVGGPNLPITELRDKFFILDDTPGVAPPQSLLVISNGNLGIGTPSPAATLHVIDSTPATLQDGGSVVIGNTSSANLAFDRTSLMARNNGGSNNLFLNEFGGNVLTCGNGGGKFGLGTFNPLGGVHIKAEPTTFGGTLTLEGDTHTYMAFYPDGVAAGRGGWLGYGGSFDNNLYIVNGLNNIIADPGGGDAFRIKGFLLVENMAIGDYHNVQWNNEDFQFYYDNSTRRHKENIEPLEDDFGRLLDAQPMTYTRPGKPERHEIGYLAEDFEELGLTHLLQYDKEGRPDGVNYEKAILYLVEIAKAQRDQIADQEARIEDQKSRIDDLTERLDRLESMTVGLSGK